MNKRSKAAYKAHETRRKNALFEKRSKAAHKAHETRNAEVIQPSQVIEALIEYENGGVAPHRSSRLLNKYVQQQEAKGVDGNRCRAAIKAHVTRRRAA